MTEPAGVVFAPMRLEAWALRGLPVVRIGIGPGSAGRVRPAGACVLAGVCGALAPDLVVGDVVVAQRVGEPAGATETLERAEEFAGLLRRHGIDPRVGQVVSTPGVTHGRARAALAADGALAVDMESAWVAQAVEASSLVVVRVVMDVAGRALVRPGTAVAGVRALRRLAALRPAIAAWLAQRPSSAEAAGQGAVERRGGTVQQQRHP